MESSSGLTNRTHGILSETADLELFTKIQKNRQREKLCLEKSKKFLTVAALISTFALIILGGLALVGMFLPPQSPLGVLAGTFGQIGTIATLSGGLVLFVSILVVLVGRFHEKDLTPSALNRDSLSHPPSDV